mmetsp:Transcript_47419/g.136972  ORF Transcript_47419/g.136972 Transcript_47419/m.136972 type:complete len:82 (+) Transcript_47419:80-325(+)
MARLLRARRHTHLRAVCFDCPDSVRKFATSHSIMTMVPTRGNLQHHDASCSCVWYAFVAITIVWRGKITDCTVLLLECLPA